MLAQGVKFLARNSVRPRTQQAYLGAVEEFQAHVLQRGDATEPHARLDATLERFLGALRNRGEAAYVGRLTLFGLIWYMGLPSGDPATLPCSKQALRGWARLSPGGSRDPLPWIVLCLIAVTLLAMGTKDAILSAAALVLSGDMYFRPAE